MTWSDDTPAGTEADPIGDLDLRGEDAQDVVGGSPSDKKPYVTFGLQNATITSSGTSPPTQQ
jgi:hypothetical protein